MGNEVMPFAGSMFDEVSWPQSVELQWVFIENEGSCIGYACMAMGMFTWGSGEHHRTVLKLERV